MGTPKGTYYDWNDAALKRLAKLWADGLSGSEIASKMGGGLTRCAVLGKVSRIGLPRRRWSRRIIRKKLGRPATNPQRADWLAEPIPAPRDTRTLEQRIFGDPMPGRSALDQRRQA